MKKVCFLLLFSCQCFISMGQSVIPKLSAALQQMEKDSQMEAALISLYVIDRNTGAILFEKNSRYGMAPASTQKLFTSAAAFDILGPKYIYTTTINLYREKRGDHPGGLIEILGTGDPSLGSWRFNETKKDRLLADWAKAIGAADSKITWRRFYVKDVPSDDLLTIPEGYIWQDIGNYYGAGTSLVNWNENQYDVVFSSGAPGSAVSVVKVDPIQGQLLLRSNVKAGEAGSGDNAYIYGAPFTKEAFIRGTIPPGQKAFTISGSMPDAAYTLAFSLQNELRRVGLQTDSLIYTSRNLALSDSIRSSLQLISAINHRSPTLDSLIYWFLRKSINLYGEAFVKTLALQKAQKYDLENGLELVKDFWVSKGIQTSNLQLMDGSGLSPQNRVTTKALVQVLQYSSTRDWYPAFYNALPEYNGMKMKSGSIGGSRAFAGYHTAKDGKKYVFAFIVNNYTGSSGDVVKKMYRVLDVLK